MGPSGRSMCRTSGSSSLRKPRAQRRPRQFDAVMGDRAFRFAELPAHRDFGLVPGRGEALSNGGRGLGCGAEQPLQRRHRIRAARGVDPAARRHVDAEGFALDLGEHLRDQLVEPDGVVDVRPVEFDRARIVIDERLGDRMRHGIARDGPGESGAGQRRALRRTERAHPGTKRSQLVKRRVAHVHRARKGDDEQKIFVVRDEGGGARQAAVGQRGQQPSLVVLGCGAEARAHAAQRLLQGGGGRHG